MSDLPAFRRLHRLWLAFVLVVVGILATVPLLAPDPSDIPLALTGTLAVAGGVAAVVAIVAIDLTFAASHPSDDARALREYEARVTLGLAIAQAPAVLGFALAFAFGQRLPAAIGGGFALIALARARPSRARLLRLEDAWQTAGRDVSALRAAQAEAVGVRSPEETQPQDPASPDDGEEPASDEDR